MGGTAECCLHLLVGPLLLSIGLGVEPGGKAGCGPLNRAERTPHLRVELGTPVGNDVRRDAMKAEHVSNQEICGLSLGGKLGKSDEVRSLGETVDHGEDGGVALRHGQTGDEVQGDVRPRPARNG